MLANTYDLNLVDVPYEGDTNAALALIRGDVLFTFCAVNTVDQHVESGDIKILAIQAQERPDKYSDVPLFQETSYPIPGIASYIGLFAPAGTPVEVVDKLDAAMAEAMADPEVQKTLIDMGFTIQYQDKNAFQKDTIDVFAENVAPIIKECGLYEE